jgi:hypothetical protein
VLDARGREAVVRQFHARFADRELSFMYYLRVDEYVAALRGRERMPAYERAAPADRPEGSAGWRRHAPPPA